MTRKESHLWSAISWKRKNPYSICQRDFHDELNQNGFRKILLTFFFLRTKGNMNGMQISQLENRPINIHTISKKIYQPITNYQTIS